MSQITVAFGMCGSFCTHQQALEQMEKMAQRYPVQPVLSEMGGPHGYALWYGGRSAGKGGSHHGKKPICTICEAEPIGPRHMADLMVVCPCTGNTLGKLSNGITDTSVTMAVKSCLRIGLPVVLAVASNDALAASAPNLFRLMNTKHVYFVPLRQDNSALKPTSLVCRFEYLLPACDAALQGRQLQPVLL